MNTSLRIRTCVLLVLLMISSAAWACQVPVFRYALERWNPDQYQVFVLNRGALNTTLNEGLTSLRGVPQGPNSKRLAPVKLSIVDTNNIQDPRLQKLWAKWPDKDQPLLTAFYPTGSDAPRELPAYAGVANKKNVAALLNSPVRKEVMSRLAQGHSAVWIFVGSGKEKQDKVAYETLQKQLKLDAEWLELPEADELEVSPDVLTKTKIKLKIEFSIVRLDRKHAGESCLLDLLLNSESDLKSFDEPMAFPVFGRGRVLYGLVGKGIAPDTIRAASSFVAGPCSCQVKNQNPGFDLLMVNDWDEAVGDILISEPIKGVDEASLEPTLLTIPPGRSSLSK